MICELWQVKEGPEQRYLRFSGLSTLSKKGLIPMKENYDLVYGPNHIIDTVEVKSLTDNHNVILEALYTVNLSSNRFLIVL